MSRIHPIDVEQANGKTKDLLSAVQKSLGTVPNLFKRNLSMILRQIHIEFSE
jgi:hypothetical protein